jgi:hypothetical protein
MLRRPHGPCRCVANLEFFCVNLQWPATKYEYNRPLGGEVLVESLLASLVGRFGYTQVRTLRRSHHPWARGRAYSPSSGK